MGTKITLLLLVAAVGAGALFATKPGPAEIEAKIADRIIGDIQNTGSSDLAGDILLLTCKANLNDCVQLIRATMDVRTEDKILWQKVTIAQGNRTVSCLGVLNQLHCSRTSGE